MDDLTSKFYSTKAKNFSEQRMAVDLSQSYAFFFKEIPSGGHILDVGCGGGRDSCAFLSQGFRVTALDGCLELVEIARELTGLPVQHRLFEEIEERKCYDGIWASASLVHLRKVEFPFVLERLCRALKVGGVLCISLKEGSGEGRDEDSRFFSYYSAQELREMMGVCAGLSLLSLDRYADLLGRPLFWLRLFAKRAR